ncbi:hypothetical protein [Paenibacillus sp. Z3-2]
MKNHWGKEDVNNIAARLDLKGNGDNTFSPNRSEHAPSSWRS